jgi:hypothetical protein
VIDNLCALFVGDSVKRRSRRIIRQHVGLERNTGERVGEVDGTADGEISR